MLKARGKRSVRKNNYVTKRIVKSAMGSAIRKASAAAKQSMGYVVKAENGWVIREDLNGVQTRISRIDPTHQSVALD
jgi:hypothetical protein